jgi:trk system potassium uptake protein TrkH
VNARAVRFLLGALCLLMAVLLLAPAAVSLGYGERATAEGFAASSVLVGLLGALLVVLNRRSLRTPEGRPAFFRREAIAVVVLAWVVASLVGALPFLLCAPFASPVDALFESASGFTTTGASIFDGAAIDTLPRGVAFWRSLSHWIGGIGIVLVFVALMPTGGRTLFMAEGITREASTSRARDSALALIRVYVALTAIHVVCLVLAGTSWFDGVIHAFSTMATGGFSNHGASAAHFGSALIEGILIVFMVAAGMDFALWDRLLRQGPALAWAEAKRSAQLRTYLGLLAGGALALALFLWFWGGSNGRPGSDVVDYRGFVHCLRDASFNLVSMQTCTGYSSADFDRWPDICRVFLMAVAFLGGCAGSTAGGIKVLRLVVIVKVALSAVQSFVRPRAVQHMRLGGAPLGDEMTSAVTRYVVVWGMLAFAGALALAILGMGATEAITGTISCMSNVGPGLGSIGPSASYGELNDASKIVLAALMLLGRLEIYPLIAMAFPGFWRR